MPIDDITASTGVPVKLHRAPKFIDLFGQCLFGGITVFKILAHAEQTLHEEATLDKVAAIVLGAKGFHFARRPVEPMGPDTMETVGPGQPVDNVGEAIHALFTADEATVDTHQQTGNAEAAARRGHYVLVVLGIDAIHVEAFSSHARYGFGSIPHIIKMRFFDIVE